MKRFTGILAIQFVVLFSAAFLGSWAYSHWRGAAATHPSDAGEMSWFQSELGVQASQADALAKLDRAFEDQQAQLCEQHCAKRVELAALIKNGDAMTPPMETLSRELCDLEAKSQRLTVEHIFAVGKLLDTAQREKFADKVYRQMCDSCPMGLHRKTTGKQVSQACGTKGCGCCVASDDSQPAPAKPVASAPPSLTKVSTPGVPTFSIVDGTRQPVVFPKPVAVSASRSALPLFVSLSSFLI